MDDQKKIKSIREEIQEAAMAELGIADLPQKDQEEIVDGFGTVVFQAAIISMLDVLPEPKRAPFLSFVEKQDEPGLRAFLLREVPDYEKRIRTALQEEVRRFKEFSKDA